MLWVTDADNTLWDTNSVYSKAQLGLLAAVREALDVPLPVPYPLDWLRAIDQDIAKVHAHGLRYPPSLLISAVASRLVGQPVARLGKSSIDMRGIMSAPIAHQIERAYLADLQAEPVLRLGVLEGINSLKGVGARVIVVTEGSRERIVTTLDSHGLSRSIDSVLEAKKSAALFARIRAANTAASAWAIGDQLDRDIIPAIEAGFAAIYFEGGFRPRWDVDASGGYDYLVCASYDDAVDAALKQN